MTAIPQSDILTTQRLCQVFNNTSATYKFYWFLSILQMHNDEETCRMDVWDLVIRMVANAWYPIHYFHLSFGMWDSLNDIVTDIQWTTSLPMDATREEIINCLTSSLENKEIKKKLRTLTLNVPYRFLSPWISTSDNKEMVERSHNLENGCLYSIHKNGNDFFIAINPIWTKYLKDYYGILTDFVNWNLTLFLQSRNPNIPNIPNKLARPTERTSLYKQRKFWEGVINGGCKIHCIYTGRKIVTDSFSVDHFLPWSFVAHDQLWNLIPADPSINSSKSDKLPPLEFYLPKLAEEHRKALKSFLTHGGKEKDVDDFASLGYAPKELINLNRERYIAAYHQTFSPLFQIAHNMGYEVWDK